VRWERDNVNYYFKECEDCAIPGPDRKGRSMAAHYSRPLGQKIGMGKTTS
jgi:hypothetical protein